ncbi:MAG: zinc ribbon domain-containing protein [Sedimentisphaerales bacterium]|nr:zinc ribbon domain-containing protein [Sedimentisphaerales bacterium]
MKSFLIRYKSFLLFCLVVLSISVAAMETRHRVDLGEFIKEITIINVSPGQSQSAIWLPFEFNAAVSADSNQTDISFLRSYLIFMVNCSIESNGKQIYATQAEIQKRATLKSTSFSRLKPLDSVPPQVQKNLDSIKSAISASAGTNMHMLVFDFKDITGKPMVDAATRDKLTLILEPAGAFSKAEFVWHTPFDAVTAAGICPKCGEKIKAKWHYCPWCGNKL